MPENEEHNVPQAGARTQPESAQERFKREQLTRRQALRKFGLTAGMATFAMFSVDDLARMVGKVMQQRAGDNKVAGQVAQEFQQAGIAYATTSGPSAPCANDPNPSCCDAMQTFKNAYAKCKKSGGSGADLEFCIAQARLDCGSTVSALGCAIDNYCSKNY